MDRTESPQVPRILNDRRGLVGMPKATSLLPLVLFGLVFVATGLFIVAAAVGWISAQEESFHAPRWVVGCIGGVFAASGLWVVGMGVQGSWRRHLLDRNRRRHPYEPAHADYVWNPVGVTQDRFGTLAGSLCAALAITAFLVPFNYWAFVSGRQSIVLQIGVGIFDFIALCCWGAFLYTLVWAIKYGPAHLTWASFPVRRNAVVLQWEPGRGLRNWKRGTFTLRCIQERIETAVRGKSTELRRIHECMWEEIRVMQGRPSLAGGGVTLEFVLPDSAPVTAMCGDPPVYWELEVKIDRPGVDFMTRYLVPIYR